MKYRRWLLAEGLFIALVADFIVVRNAMMNSWGAVYPSAALVGLALSILVALALATKETRPFILAAALLLFGFVGAFGVGSLYATCDLNMRPFISQLVLLFGAVFLVGMGPVFVVPFILWGIASLAGKFLRGPSAALAILLTVVAIPCVAVGTYFDETAAGAHPTEGNCVI